MATDIFFYFTGEYRNDRERKKNMYKDTDNS